MQADLRVQERQLTELDFTRLRTLNSSRPLAELDEVLDAADIVPGPEIEAAVITMYTQFELEEVDTRERRVLAICYPDDAEPSSGFISVLSPLGRSLIGMRAGNEVRWQTPRGSCRTVRVGAVLFQPEASGDYVT
ncbi:GreA/GreB family elongation factor [Ramlibacter rhizophilus]|uniref:Transcription elongation factor GreAB n=1 Tax=Ramlibacter rhizophilus TaxID=1781167 RepID=A0A4Z0BRK0_9BURK|nr:GreA/GreB family elongation factor [Ramlibacter rhizophilus]TFZ01084.1 transcription elongation factor GreAB [Ramlibacter rhizophilus]